jgi:hypothetical protein
LLLLQLLLLQLLLPLLRLRIHMRARRVLLGYDYTRGP